MEITKEKIAQLKKNHKDLWLYETEDKKYKAIFRPPTRTEFGIIQSVSLSESEMNGAVTFANTCFVFGDREVIDNDKYFHGLRSNIMEIIEVVDGELKKL